MHGCFGVEGSEALVAEGAAALALDRATLTSSDKMSDDSMPVEVRSLAAR